MAALIPVIISLAAQYGPAFATMLMDFIVKKDVAFTDEDIVALKALVKNPEEYFK